MVLNYKNAESGTGCVHRRWLVHMSRQWVTILCNGLEDVPPKIAISKRFQVVTWYMSLSAHLSPRSEWYLHRLSRFCKAHQGVQHMQTDLFYLLASVKKTKAEYWEAFSSGHKHPVNVWGTLLRKDGYDVKCLCDCRPASTEYLPGGEWCSTARTGHDQRHVYSASFPDANSRVTGSRGGSCMWSSFCALWKIISSCFSNGGDRPHRCMLPPR